MTDQQAHTSQVGGGYIFVCRTLMEHFASLITSEILVASEKSLGLAKGFSNN